jgi:histone chaperone ASF1
MAEVGITAVDVLNNPAPFADDIELEVQYECLSALKDDLEWKVIYVGSAESEAHDQVLDTAFVGPVQQGVYKFTMKAPAPDVARIPQGDVVGVTAMMLTCSYQVRGWGWGGVRGGRRAVGGRLGGGGGGGVESRRGCAAGWPLGSP